MGAKELRSRSMLSTERAEGEVLKSIKTPKSLMTRTKIIKTAEKLLAQHGIDNVTLSQINQAAGQSNKNATIYHFASREGLLQAIIDKHTSAIAYRREQLIDAIGVEDDQLTVRQVAEVFVYPVAEKLFDEEGGRDFIRINAQLVSRYSVDFMNKEDAAIVMVGVVRLRKMLMQCMGDLPVEVAQQRAMLAASLLFHGLADYCKYIEYHQIASLDWQVILYIEQMVESIVAILSAPITDHGWRIIKNQ